MTILPRHSRPYEPSSSREARLDFAVKAMEAVYQIPAEPSEEWKKKFFWTAVWLVSERDGKYSPRYRSRAALDSDEKFVQHEHIFPIKDLWLLRTVRSLEATLNFAEGCLVTKEEHQRLSAEDRRIDRPYGWMRYLSARIEVVDMSTSQSVTPAEMSERTALFAKAMWQTRFHGDGKEEWE